MTTIKGAKKAKKRASLPHEKRSKAKLKSKKAVVYGRATGRITSLATQPFNIQRMGTGETHYEHGLMTFCDDGNGNQWSAEDDDYEEDY